MITLTETQRAQAARVALAGRLDELAPEWDAVLDAVAEEWIAIGCCTDPADRETAERGIALAWQAAGLVTPKVIWVLSIAEAERTLAALGADKQDLFSNSCYGQQDAEWLAFYHALHLCGIGDPEVEGLSLIARSAFWFWPYDDTCIICDRPAKISTKRVTFRDGTYI